MPKLVSYLESVISGRRIGVFSAVLKFGLLPLSWAFLGTVKLRRWLYFRGILRARHLPCKVISVGNVAAGGSGKTPAVIAIARILRKRNVAVLSRGYHSDAKSAAVVSDGEEILLDAVAAGDEPYLLGHKLPGVPVLIGKDRIQNGLTAIHEWNCQIILLDDGFQYLRLARDIDIVVIDASRSSGFDHVFPRGYLREPLSAVVHADLILLTRVDQCTRLDFVHDKLARIAPLVPIFESVHKPRLLRLLNTNQEIGLDAVKGRNILAVCGIANPASFAETLRSLEPASVELISFPDHHEYLPSSIEMIRQRAAKSDVDMIITTEKDAPKLRHISDFSILSLIVELELVGSAAEGFAEFIFRTVDQ